MRVIANIAKNKVDENAARLASHLLAWEGAMEESFVDLPFHPVIPRQDGYSMSDSEPLAPPERKKNSTNKEKSRKKQKKGQGSSK